MNLLRSLTASLLLLALSSGCTRTDEPAPPMNAVMGAGVVGAPFHTGSVDAGILEDQSSYKPKYEPLPPISLGGSSATGAAAVSIGSGPAAVLPRLVKACLERNLDVVLDSFVPEQVAALTEDKAELVDAVDALDQFLAALYAKLNDEQKKQVEAGPQQAVALLEQAFVVEEGGDDTATLRVDPQRASEISAQFQAMAPQLAGLMGTQAPTTTTAEPEPASTSESQPAESLTLRKVDGDWRIDLGRTLTSDQAEGIRDFASALRDALTRATEQVTAMETLDPQAMLPMMMTTFGSLVPKWQELQAQFEAGENP